MIEAGARVSFAWRRGQPRKGTEEGARWLAREWAALLAQKRREAAQPQDGEAQASAAGAQEEAGATGVFAFEDVAYGDVDTADIEQSLRLLCETLEARATPHLIAGGDHSEAIGTVLATLNCADNRERRVGVIWVDAHADINTYSSSITKNYHGMPLAFALGHETRFAWTAPKRKLDKDNLIYWGIRDLDAYEHELVGREHIRVVGAHDDHAPILDFVRERGLEYVHLSIDVDGLDPVHMPCTGTRAPNGISLDACARFLRDIRAHCAALAIPLTVEIVEYNPLIGTPEDLTVSQRTLRQLLECLV